MGDALARPGMDPRVWCLRGTVATVKTDGSFDYSDASGIVIAPRGIDVDVVLEPFDHPVTCRYGLNFGGGVILAPIKPGNLVLVEFPQGDIAAIPEIVKVCSGPHTPQPVEDTDQKPVFRNDRVLIYGDGYPVEVRTSGGAKADLGVDGSISLSAKGGAQVVLGTDGSVKANEGSNGVARVGDPIKTILSATDLSAIATSLISAGILLPGTPTGPPKPVPINQDGTGTNAIKSGSATVFAGD
jgi:hypothetical protein